MDDRYKEELDINKLNIMQKFTTEKIEPACIDNLVQHWSMCEHAEGDKHTIVCNTYLYKEKQTGKYLLYDIYKEWIESTKRWDSWDDYFVYISDDDAKMFIKDGSTEQFHKYYKEYDFCYI